MGWILTLLALSGAVFGAFFAVKRIKSGKQNAAETPDGEKKESDDSATAEDDTEDTARNDVGEDRSER